MKLIVLLVYQLTFAISQKKKKEEKNKVFANASER